MAQPANRSVLVVHQVDYVAVRLDDRANQLDVLLGERLLGAGMQLLSNMPALRSASGNEHILVVVGQAMGIERLCDRPGVALVEHADDRLVAPHQPRAETGPADFQMRTS